MQKEGRRLNLKQGDVFVNFTSLQMQEHFLLGKQKLSTLPNPYKLDQIEVEITRSD